MLALIVMGCQRDAAPGDAAATKEMSVPLYADLGTLHREITTSVPRAQQYFDQGLRLTYAFNHAEAIRAFREAARLDTVCAMCWWGIAFAYGPNINAPMDSASALEAWAAVQQAQKRAASASPREQAYISAIATRYAEIPPAARAPFDSAFASAMADVARAEPNDPDAATIYAESLMDLRPWEYWQKDGKPYPGTTEIVSTLEAVLAKFPDHPGACHFYIHAMEASQPEKAVPCAERLASLMPGAGHLVHMPAHIYIRVGRWNDAIEANRHAVHTDETYIADQKPTGFYPAAYYPHNHHFLSFAASMAGRSADAIAAARNVVKNVPIELARQYPDLEGMLTQTHLTLVRFGRWDEVLSEPAPPSDLRFATALLYYARGVAHAAKGSSGDANAALDSVRTIRKGIPASLPATILEIAEHSLAGEIAGRAGRHADAVRSFELARTLEDGLTYIEPPYWYYPVRHSLAAELIAAGRTKEAEARYRESLSLYPENGWSLFGLAASLRAQGKNAEATEVEARFNTAWAGADVKLAASRF
jgi:tetratricopeptide (TPR) repeat protein